VACIGRLVAGDDTDADITSRSRDTVRRHEFVRTLPQQHYADRALCCRDVPRTIRSVVSVETATSAENKRIISAGSTSSRSLANFLGL